MPKNLVARASTTVNAPVAKVWSALTDPAIIKQYFFGSTVTSDWKKGSRITWKGEWQGKPYEDKGEVLEAEPGARLSYTHYSPMMGKPDLPENYHTVTIDLRPDGNRTSVSLSQDNNDSEDARKHSEQNWEMMLQGLKRVVEA